MAPNPYCDSFLAGFTGSSPSTFNVSATAVGACALNPWLSFPLATASGVASGANGGDTFTFQVTYWGAAPPAQNELRIDLDGNGVFALGTVSGGIGPSINEWGPVASGSVLLIGFLVLGGTALSGRGRFPLPQIGSVFGLMLLAAGLYGCGGGGGASAPATPAPAATVEVFTMVETDAGDNDSTDGKTYSVDVVIDSAGSYAYQFVFGDGSVSARGTAALELKLTVN